MSACEACGQRLPMDFGYPRSMVSAEMKAFVAVGRDPSSWMLVCHEGDYGSMEEAALGWASHVPTNNGVVRVFTSDPLSGLAPTVWRIERAALRATRVE